MNRFNQKAKQELKSYVYCLVDPRDSKIFYVGKGKGDRVFDHANDALQSPVESDKLNKIREIINTGNQVKYYILRHSLTDEVAIEIESVLIDFLTYPAFNLERVLTTIQSGHNQTTRGIKTVDEINIMYDCPDIKIHPDDNVVFINVNRSYRPGKDIYQAAKGDWPLALRRVQKVTHVIVHYHGIVIAVYRPTQWHRTADRNDLVWFEGELIPESPYKDTSVKRLNLNTRRGTQYYNK